jgi:trans-aconitate methyltransferase
VLSNALDRIIDAVHGRPARRSAWGRHWERQQANYVADREASFALMLDLIDRLGAAPGRLVDLGRGPGSIAARALERWSSAEVVGADLDPFRMELEANTR